MTKEELRLESYRRLANVTTHGDVDDIRAEWVDRYGPVPEPAEALLTVAALRAECFRTGIRDVMVTSREARIGPIELRTSEEMRLKRLSRAAIYKEAIGQLVLPLPRGIDPTVFLVDFLKQIRPPQPVLSVP